MDEGNKKYIFERKTYIAPVDFSGYLNAEEIKKAEDQYGPLLAVVTWTGKVIKPKDK